MNTVSYNCPCCGGPLKFSGESGKLECTACGNHYEPEALEMMTPDESGDEITFANDAKRRMRPPPPPNVRTAAAPRSCPTASRAA